MAKSANYYTNDAITKRATNRSEDAHKTDRDKKLSEAKKLCDELNSLAGFERFIVSSSQARDGSYNVTIFDKQTRKSYGYGSIVGSVSLSKIKSDLQKGKISGSSFTKLYR